MSESILDREPNFLSLYLYHIGDSEVPRTFHLWSALSLIAACVGDRVLVEVDVARSYCPNLYVFLIGPSGGGKGEAISTALRLLMESREELKRHYQQGGYDPQHAESTLDIYAGMATKQAFLDYMAKDAHQNGAGMRVVVRPCTYFVTEELGMAMRPGELAHDLIMLMTGLYTRPPFPIVEGTRGRGFIQFEQPTLNWLAGSTEELLIKSIPRDSIEGGFWARTIGVRGRRNYDKRRAQILYPDDYHTVREHLVGRLVAYTYAVGSYTLTPEARALHDHWYNTRALPEDRISEPFFNRADELVYRLGLLLSLADWNGTFNAQGEAECPTVIGAAHIDEAIEMWTSLAGTVPEIIGLASASPQTSDMMEVEAIIQRMHAIDRTMLMRKVANRGMNKDRLDKALASLQEKEVITAWTDSSGERPRRMYTWTKEELHAHTEQAASP